MKLSELSIADLHAVSEICKSRLEKTGGLSIKAVGDVEDILDSVADELADRIVDIHAEIKKAKR
jgi:hypothetical protein